MGSVGGRPRVTIKYRPSAAGNPNVGQEVTNAKDFFQELFGDEGRWMLTKEVYDSYPSVKEAIDSALGGPDVMSDFGFARTYAQNTSESQKQQAMAKIKQAMAGASETISEDDLAMLNG